MERHVALPADAASICSHSESSCGPPRLSPRYGSSHSFLLPVELLDRWEAQLAAPGKETRGETVKAASDSWHPRPPCPGHRWHRPDVTSPPDRAMGVLLQREGNKIMNTPPTPAPACGEPAYVVGSAGPEKKNHCMACSLILPLVSCVKYFQLR